MRASSTSPFAALLAAGALALGASAAGAAPGERRGYYITPVEMLEVYGVYRLDNGDTLRITREKRRYWAQTSGAGKVEIEPVASIVFVSADGSRKFTFIPTAFTTEVRVTEVRGAGLSRAPAPRAGPGGLSLPD